MAGERIEVVELDDASDRRPIGGKAEGLRRLAACGLPVPPGMVITCGASDEDIAPAAAAIAHRFAGHH